MRRSNPRIPLAVAFFIALSGACGGDDDATSAKSEPTPGPSVPQPPANRSLSAEGEMTITLINDVDSTTLVPKVEASGLYAGRESGFNLVMTCGDTVAEVEVSLFFARGPGVYFVERRNGRWFVDNYGAEVVTSSSGGDAGSDASADADAAGATDASAAQPSPDFVNGVGLPGVDGRREVRVALIADKVRYDVRATIPWRASISPAACDGNEPVAANSGSSGGCGSGNSSSRRSSGGDWD